MAKDTKIASVPQNGGTKPVADPEAGMANTFAGGMHPLSREAFRARLEAEAVRGLMDLAEGTLTIVLPLADFTAPCPVSMPGKDNRPSKSWILASSGGFGTLDMATCPSFLAGRRIEVNAFVTTLIVPRGGKGEASAAPVSIMIG